MKKTIATIAVGAALLAFALPVLASGQFDNWKGALVSNPNVNNEYDDAYGKVILNYVSGQDSWVVNLNAFGLIPGISYQVIFYQGGSPASHSLGCFVANKNGNGHLNTKGINPSYINPTLTVPGDPRVNVRLDNTSTEDCDGLENSAALTTGVNWSGMELVPAGSMRPE